ncbi:hypothetical protein [Pseudomonas sp. Pseusp3]|uniref:hypothetical protein n=1 Tax=unclassified Pseudomonas TaxID=196821 RepID=UPI0039B0A836
MSEETVLIQSLPVEPGAESIPRLKSVAAPACVMMDPGEYHALHGTALGTLQAVLSERFDKDDFVLLHILKPYARPSHPHWPPVFVSWCSTW